MKRIIWQTAIALFLASLASVDAADMRPAQAEFTTLPSSYGELYRQISVSEGGDKHLTASRCLGLSAIACRLNRLTPSAELRDLAVRLLRQALSQRPDGTATAEVRDVGAAPVKISLGAQHWEVAR